MKQSRHAFNTNIGVMVGAAVIRPHRRQRTTKYGQAWHVAATDQSRRRGRDEDRAPPGRGPARIVRATRLRISPRNNGRTHPTQRPSARAAHGDVYI
jgi:hypothetical protein